MAPPSARAGVRLPADNRYGITGSPALVVVGPVVGSVLVGVARVVAGAAVVVGAVVVVGVVTGAG